MKPKIIFISILMTIALFGYSRTMTVNMENNNPERSQQGKTPTKPTFKIGIAFSGGGVKGICHAGVLKALEEYGIRPKVISGTSAGAIVAALYADGYTPEEIMSFFDNLTFSKLTDIQLPDGGFFSMKSFEKFLDSKLHAKTFEELHIALRVVATNLDNGTSVAFSSGDLLQPIIASCSMPVMFSPKIIDQTTYVDGGVLKNFPVSTIRDECRYVIGVNCSPMVTDDYKLNVVSVATRAYHFMFRANSIHDKALCDILIEPKEIGHYDTFDVEKSREIFELGYKTTVELMENETGQKFLALLKANK